MSLFSHHTSLFGHNSPHLEDGIHRQNAMPQIHNLHVFLNQVLHAIVRLGNASRCLAESFPPFFLFIAWLSIPFLVVILFFYARINNAVVQVMDIFNNMIPLLVHAEANFQLFLDVMATTLLERPILGILS
jgi:hypothetical protein